MQVTVSCECVQKSNQLPTVVGSEAKNPLPINASDMIGLTWVFEDEFSDLKRDC